MPEAVFRFDASPQIGFGHAVRSATLAGQLRRFGWTTVAAVNDEAVDSELRWQDAFAAVTIVPADRDGELTALQASRRGCDLLVVDNYAWDANLEHQCRGWAKRILAIDDTAERRHDANMLLCPSLGVDAGEFSGLVPDNCIVLAGAAYVQMSASVLDFRSCAAERRAMRGQVKRILIAMGGGKLSPELSALVKIVRGAMPHALIDLVVTSRKTLSPASPATNVYVNTPRLPSLMADADIAVGAAGVSALERCCLGLPSIVFITADNQARQAAALASDQLAIVLGALDERHAGALEPAIRELADDGDRRLDLSQRSMAHIDGLGAERVARVVEEVL
jgi:UDP-2,4-diacetamido-2,4,6-trideoxy-beta-L-altropyranose hydrolase